MRFSILILIGLCVSSGFTQAQDANLDYTRWSLPEGARTRISKGRTTGRNPIALSPDGTRLVVTTTIGVWIYDTVTSQELALLTGHTGRVYSVAFSPNGELLASRTEDETIRLWNTKTGKQKAVYPIERRYRQFMVFSPDGKTLAGPVKKE